ncbi:family 43 glycosylhydrolase [Mangrovibacterium sp.]|uniref:family 43 glycosylhydrolase n=1 Tax=Mangrovibacterium sp. TaxID=1961364 RepID=UPI00356906EF
MTKLYFILILFALQESVLATNPIIPNKGANDPHIRIMDGKAYLSASHDKSIDNKGFVMEDWWLWSSDDLVTWKHEYTLTPEETYIGKPFASCWATDIVKRNGKFYWYFSEGNEQTGVMVADSPNGPWRDPLGKPLLTSEMTPTHEYDLGIVQDQAGEYYIVFGVWDYYIAKLNEDMISLAEKPQKIEINNPCGPYNLDGKNMEKPTDDKPFMHYYRGNYYLSWGCFYAMGKSVYGPFDYKGCIMDSTSFASGYIEPTWPTGFRQGRHGSFFQWHNQSYFAYCDISQTGNRYFRDTFMSYVHYKENGEIALIRVDGTGVGNYQARNGTIEAEDFYDSSGIEKVENNRGGFSISAINDGEYLIFNNVGGLKEKKGIRLNFSKIEKCTVELRKNNPGGDLISSITCRQPQSYGKFTTSLPDTINLCFVFKGEKVKSVEFDSYSFE